MPVYVKGDHKVNVSGEEEVARFEAAGYSAERTGTEKSAAKPSEKAPAKKSAAKPSEK